MIWDTFLFRDELDMLEFRLTHLQGEEDVRHVLVEAPVTHRGLVKPLYYELKKEHRFARWADRVTHVVCRHLPTEAECSDPWVREHLQRECLRQAVLEQAVPGDLVLLADVDEIPDVGVVRTAPPGQPCVLRQRIFAFAVDWEFPHTEYTSVVVPRGMLAGSPLYRLRDQRGLYPQLGGAGWHFSWLGGNAAISAKAAAHCHREDDEALRNGVSSGALYRDGVGIWGFNLEPRDVDETWPDYIRQRRCPDSWFRPRE